MPTLLARSPLPPDQEAIRAMFEHEHLTSSPNVVNQQRIQFGIRFWFTDIWPKGYIARRIHDESGQPIVAGAIVRA